MPGFKKVHLRRKECKVSFIVHSDFLMYLMLVLFVFVFMYVISEVIIKENSNQGGKSNNILVE